MQEFKGMLIITYVCAYKASAYYKNYIERAGKAQKEADKLFENRKGLRLLNSHNRVELKTMSKAEWDLLVQRDLNGLIKLSVPLMREEVDNLKEILNAEGDDLSIFKKQPKTVTKVQETAQNNDETPPLKPNTDDIPPLQTKYV